MRKLLILCFFLSFVGASTSVNAQQGPKDGQTQPTAEHMAQLAEEAWLGLIDSARYAESWKTAAAAFQASVTEDKWMSTLKNVRDPLGGVQTRRLQSATYTTALPGVPDGDYVVLLYESSFEHKQTAQETVIVSREKDKVWRVAGYYIK